MTEPRVRPLPSDPGEWDEEFELPDDPDAGDRSYEREWDRFDLDWETDPEAVVLLYDGGDDPVPVDRLWGPPR